MELSITFNNIKNIKSNYIFAKQLIDENDISYFCETWLPENEKLFLYELSDKCRELNKSDCEVKPTKGRPFGGQSWFINREINIIDHEFINSHIILLVSTYRMIIAHTLN